MATTVVMEALSPTMEEGRLVEWKKQPGDAVAVGDILAEVETDKAVMELVARAAGTLLQARRGGGHDGTGGSGAGVHRCGRRAGGSGGQAASAASAAGAAGAANGREKTPAAPWRSPVRLPPRRRPVAGSRPRRSRAASPRIAASTCRR